MEKRPHLYRLEGRTPVPLWDVLEWGRWYEDERWPVSRVAEDWIGSVRVSTVFLALDHNHCFTGPPILFETMAFGLDDVEIQERYETWEQAEAGHAKILARVKGVLKRREQESVGRHTP